MVSGQKDTIASKSSREQCDGRRSNADEAEEEDLRLIETEKSLQPIIVRSRSGVDLLPTEFTLRTSRSPVSGMIPSPRS
ncbi:hypothetical protein Pst134EA_032408 [Puccinia striiformis f. sp. tritici]|uniref:uncharacterized protein n=1 Tax=Puccinia striiformis f. sp. tritici TaxID=168172 RepID=UPI002007BC86|nr:uncharacterized protein Pst134EA_032408 [Puccinia striiformis f. sp. tritici]KAH9444289.1 hypothetical protein Pst134EA_032408 [Puccinia striiformis f. sp. tritici]